MLKRKVEDILGDESTTVGGAPDGEDEVVEEFSLSEEEMSEDDVDFGDVVDRPGKLLLRGQEMIVCSTL